MPVKLKVTSGLLNWSKFGFGSLMSVPESAGRSLITNHGRRVLARDGVRRRGLSLSGLLLDHERALGDSEDLGVGGLLLTGQVGEQVLRVLGGPRDVGVGLRVEQVVLRAVGRALVLEALGRLLGGDLDRVVVARERCLAPGHVRGHGVGDDVGLPVVEMELRRLPDLLARVGRVAHVRQPDPDGVGADPRDLRLGDAERVGPLADDLDRAVDVRPIDRGVLRRRASLEDQLGAALEVEAEGGLLGRDHDPGGHDRSATKARMKRLRRRLLTVLKGSR